MSTRLATVLLFVILLAAACKKDPVSPAVKAPEAPIRPVTASSNVYVTQFFEFNPAPGQFLNTGLANDSAAKAIAGNTQGLVSLGAWGGYIVYGFDHTVLDTAGPDLMIYGNAFSQFAEPGVVWVMQDLNGNGKPDDTWYELAGSETGRPGYIRNYSVTYTRPDPANGDVPWRDNKGNSGVIKTNMFHSQNYYPDNITSNTYTLTGTLLPSVNIDTTDPTYIISYSFLYGYGDNTGGGDPVDIATAIDSAGRPVTLKGIDYIKVQTGILFNMGWLGEQSTEFCGAADISLLK